MGRGTNKSIKSRGSAAKIFRVWGEGERGMKINSNEKGRVYPGPDSTIHY